MKTAASKTTLFLWRTSRSQSHGAPGSFFWKKVSCRWCLSQMKDINYPPDGWWQDEEQQCPFCGWSHRFLNARDDEFTYAGDQYYFWKELCEFEISDQQVALSELGVHLRRRYADVYSLSPRRFEELIEDVFQNYGFRTRLTPATRDEGVDIYLLDRVGKVGAIVEVKRYAEDKKVGIGVIDRLLGVQLRKGVRNAVLITSSTFSTPARAAAEEVSALHEFSLELVDAETLLRLLDVYNDQLPPLPEVIREWERDG